ncbi:hypothetical protein EVAR_13912_1 [Eumeta japonica]|uniref:Uncharacterized protein n=1 Tax=Eumeta variegata TaxID=151549 RepID=A0A4C1U8B2_EUMVA|nr:hypothetical protein EVAR_13912_1 [Eumeta japonica]
MHSLWGTLKTSLFQKARGVADLISGFLRLKTPPPVVHETVNSGQYAVPVVTKIKLSYRDQMRQINKALECLGFCRSGVDVSNYPTSSADVWEVGRKQG